MGKSLLLTFFTIFSCFGQELTFNYGGEYKIYSGVYVEVTDEGREVLFTDVETTIPEKDQLPFAIVHNQFEKIKLFAREIGLDLPDLAINIFPKILNMYDEDTVIDEQLDNAFYDPFAIKLVLTRESKKSENIALWKIPEVVLHELGHYIYYNIVPLDISVITARGDQHTTDAPSSFYFRSGRNHMLVLDAINEAFADLFVEFATESMSLEFKGHKCLASRDVTKSEFTTSYPKKIFDDHMNIYFSSFSLDNQRDSCETPRLQDSHALGSIIAYEFNSRNLHLTKVERLKLLKYKIVEIHKYLSQNHFMLSPREFFIQAMIILKN